MHNNRCPDKTLNYNQSKYAHFTMCNFVAIHTFLTPINLDLL